MKILDKVYYFGYGECDKGQWSLPQPLQDMSERYVLPFLHHSRGHFPESL
jgi:hypothetical protein